MSDKDKQSEQLSVNRRGFFRKVLLKGIERVEESGKSFMDRIENAVQHASPKPPSATLPTAKPLMDGDRPLDILRPPGALAGEEFGEACEQCGKCVEACPANAIHLDKSDEQIGEGLPYIIARHSPCVVCTDLACMPACPTGALQVLNEPTQIRMGVAKVNDDRCLRKPHRESSSEPTSEDCHLCVDHCPIGETAIRVDEETDRITVEPGCTGCGVCEWVCPTMPASIVIQPMT